MSKIEPDYLGGWRLSTDAEVVTIANIDTKQNVVEDTCKNIGEDYAECDQFVCSKCGIELQDWNRVERDMDDGEVSYYEYTFRFCPNCGRKIVEGADNE